MFRNFLGKPIKKPTSTITHSNSLADKVAPYLTKEDLVNMSMACKDAHALFSKSALASTMQMLLEAVVFGEYKKVEEIISENPPLLLEKGTVTDYSGVIHVGRTAYQLALGAGDFNVRDKNGNIVMDGMVEMMEKYFNKLPGKTANDINRIMYEQYRGQFPEDYEGNEALRMKHEMMALHQIINTLADAKNETCMVTSKLEDKITKSIYQKTSKHSVALQSIMHSIMKARSDYFFELAFQRLENYLILHRIVKNNLFNFDLLRSLYKFRCQLTAKRAKKFGNHFNYQLITIAAQLYEKNYVRFGNHWGTPKNLFYWQKVFGTIQRYIPACDAQCVAQGLWYILEHGEASKRTLEFRQGSNRYYPYDLDFAMDIDGDMIGHNCAWTQAGFMVKCAAPGIAGGFSDLFTSLFESKTKSSIAYRVPRQIEEQACRCVMM